METCQTQTTTTNKETRERSLDNPNQWGGTYRFTAYLQSIPINVHVVYGNALMAWLSYRDAYLLDLPPAVCFGTTPKECLIWVRRHVPAGPDKDTLLRYYSSLDSETYWSEVQRLNEQRLARFEADREEERQWMASTEYQQQQLQRLLLDFGADKTWEIPDFIKLVRMVVQHRPQIEEEIKQVLQQCFYEDISWKNIGDILEGCDLTRNVIQEVLATINNLHCT